MTEVRFALSYEALKISATPSDPQISAKPPSDPLGQFPGSMTQGPAINASGWPFPILIRPTATGFGTEAATPDSFPRRQSRDVGSGRPRSPRRPADKAIPRKRSVF